MPQEPKKRHSRQRQGKRRAAIKLVAFKAVSCPNCQNPTLPHTVCKNCGYYKGREVINMTKKVSKKDKPDEDQKSEQREEK